ncbi:TPA: hypothetical protein HA243_03280 [Candidatus Micrarchaeota archaeon]|nr:hypothetical protein [Candidatus Micrarchaeota archaeon]
MNAPTRFPLSTDIPWDKIKEVRVSKDGQNFSFEFDIVGKKQKMTLAIKPDSTSYTLSKDDGTPLVHAEQRGTEVSFVDFSKTPSKLPGWVKKMQKKGKKN